MADRYPGDHECTGKTAYGSSKSARSALRAIRHGHNSRADRPHRAYKCNVCGNWHLTSFSFKQRQSDG